MRTMFIPHLLIIFFCLLSVTAEDSNYREVECESTGRYKCHVPQNCLNTGMRDKINIKRLTDEDVLNNCPVLFRYYAYAKHYVHFSIDSFRENISRIEIKIREAKTSLVSTISCSKAEDGTGIGDYHTSTNNQSSKKAKITAYTEDDNPNPLAKLRCNFTVELPKGETVFFIADSESVLTTVFTWTENGVPTSTAKHTEGIFGKDDVRCDPHDIKLILDVMDSKKAYKPVQWKAGEYFCNDSNIYKMEFRENEFEEYRTAKENIKCEKREVGNEYDFKVDGITPPFPIDMRCFADARFFCDKGVHVKKGESNMNYTSPDIKSNRTSALSCPKDKPHLIANRMLYRDASFECVNTQGSFRWNVTGADNKHAILDGVEVYCTAKLECTNFLKIRAASVEKGTLDQDNVPTCYSQGTLKVDAQNITKPYCDEKTGQYKYTVGGKEKIIDGDTKFECEYPQVEDVDTNAQHEKILLRTLYISIGISAFLGIAIIVCGILFLNYRIKERKKVALEKLANDELAWNQYVLNDDEREDLKYAKKMERLKLKNGSDDSEKEQSLPITNLSKWNDMQLHFFSVATRAIFKDATTTTPPVHLKHMDVLPKPDDDLIKAPGFVNEKASIAPPDTLTKQRMRAAFAERLAKQFR